MANVIIDDDTVKYLNYRQLVNHPKHQKIWKQYFANKLGRLAQGEGRRVERTDIMFLISQDQVHRYWLKEISYGRIVVDYRPQKDEPHRTRLTVGGYLIVYVGDFITPTVDITAAKLIINSTISAPGAIYMCCIIKNFYLGTPLIRYEYIKIPIDILSEKISMEYNRMNLAHNGYI